MAPPSRRKITFPRRDRQERISGAALFLEQNNTAQALPPRHLHKIALPRRDRQDRRRQTRAARQVASLESEQCGDSPSRCVTQGRHRGEAEDEGASDGGRRIMRAQVFTTFPNKAHLDRIL